MHVKRDDRRKVKGDIGSKTIWQYGVKRTDFLYANWYLRQITKIKN